MTTRVRSQISFDDKVIQDDDLEDLLERRLEAKAGVQAYNKLDKETKAKIESMETKPPYRIGRFIITKKTVPGRTVNFETSESSRINISLIGD